MQGCCENGLSHMGGPVGGHKKRGTSDVMCHFTSQTFSRQTEKCLVSWSDSINSLLLTAKATEFCYAVKIFVFPSR